MKMTLKEWRRVKNITQEEMANICGVHVNTYRAWEEKPDSIRLNAAIKIADHLGVKLGDIFFAA